MSTATASRHNPAAGPRLQQVQSRTANGTILYTPRNPFERRTLRATTPAFPTPHIRPRQRRPHTIHIVSYPPGYVPTELRSTLPPTRSDRPERSDHHHDRQQQHRHRDRYHSQSAAPQSSANTPTSVAPIGPPDRPAASVQNNGTFAGLAAYKKRRRSPRKKRSTQFVRKPVQPPRALLPRQPPPSTAAITAATTAPSAPTAPTTSSAATRVFEKLLAAFTSQPLPSSRTTCPITPASRTPEVASPATDNTTEPSLSTLPPPSPSRPVSFLNLGRRLSLSRPRSLHGRGQRPASIATDGVRERLAIERQQQQEIQQQQQQQQQQQPASTTNPPAMVDALYPAAPAAGAQHGATHPNRNSFISVRSSVKNMITSSVSEVVDKPVASGGGMACSVILAEPHVFLTGFDHDGRTHRTTSNNGTALLRGKLRLTLSKNVKIRSVTLKLHGTARTEWPEGVPPLKVALFEEESLRTQALTFFHAMHKSWETPYGNQCTYSLKTATDNSYNMALNMLSSAASQSDNSSLTSGLSAKDMKRLSLQHAQSRSFGKGDSPLALPVQIKGYKVFFPGVYEYSFELPIDHHQLETIKLPFGTVRWQLETTVERAGAFKSNLHGSKEVNIVRVPDQMSLETVEPISISRQWEDQMFYDIVISGKSFPIGSKIPIAFKLTPLAKVQLHKLKVYITESAEYWTNNRRVTRKDPGRKILLFEKTAGKPLESQYAASEIRVLSGGELSPTERAEARATASRRQIIEANRLHHRPQPLPEPSDNLLGDLDLGLESYWGSTEIEMNVQLPTCAQMAKDPTLRIHPDCSWRNANVYHWIKVVMRISRLDPDDPEGKRRRHFEISIDSPFTVLNCLATQANTALPRYSGTELAPPENRFASSSCGCADMSLPATPTGSVTSVESNPGLPRPQQMPTAPQAAHLHTQHTSSSASADSVGVPSNAAAMHTSESQPAHRTASSEQEDYESPRPIHLLRVPSYAPPAFDADESPPMPLMTPPPNYDVIVGTPSVDGLADYFSRLADYDGPDTARDNVHAGNDEDSDSEGENVPVRITSRGGRVNVVNPRTPGGRHGPSRSMDIQRPNVPFHLSLTRPLRRGAE
ncbi:arrestin domain containing protein [Niveomyces insectorum RCEF 264]|uniref:Arrestin domain containing protein n=1 Tax=Niveomyces insectorum RCEF 264 TaxID=1081102 RepID=A0A167WCX3_9HYPO|nr:arrestin domain containing protein [Niveomyces insectorum RCEF 264]